MPNRVPMKANPFIKMLISLLIRLSEFAARRCKLITVETHAENFDVPVDVAVYLQRKDKVHATYIPQHNCLNTQ